MNQLTKANPPRTVADLHTALDDSELSDGFACVIRELVGDVPWEIQLAGVGDKEKPAFCGGDSSRNASSGEYHNLAKERVQLSFRQDAVGELILGLEAPLSDDTRQILSAHVGASLVKLRLWKQAEEEAARGRLDREILRNISAVLGSFDVEYVLARSVEQVMRVIGSTAGSALLWDGHRFVTSVVLGLPEEITNSIRIDGTPVVELVAEAGDPLFIRDPEVESKDRAVHQVALHLLLVIPLTSGGRVVGVIQVANPAVDEPHTPQLDAALEICKLAAIAVENALLHGEMVQQERMATIGQVMAGLSHDIKNMLQGLTGGLSLLQLGLDEGDTDIIRDSHPIIASAVDRISTFVWDMLNYSRNREPLREPSSINAIVADIRTSMSNLAEEHRVKLEASADSRMLPIPIDATGIFRCLSNLVTNAIEAVEEGGSVVIATRWDPNDPMVEIEVKDDGTGIPVEDQERVFDALHTTKGSKGTGLGLAVTKKIVEEHQGEILLDSTPGAGTTFTIRLPKNPDY